MNVVAYLMIAALAVSPNSSAIQQSVDTNQALVATRTFESKKVFPSSKVVKQWIKEQEWAKYPLGSSHAARDGVGFGIGVVALEDDKHKASASKMKAELLAKNGFLQGKNTTIVLKGVVTAFSNEFVMADGQHRYVVVCARKE